MTVNLEPDDELQPVNRSDLIGYFHPREIVADASLSVARRRALLAYWMSDANAIPGTPWMRRSGYVSATLADLREALLSLDALEAMFGAPTGGDGQINIA